MKKGKKYDEFKGMLNLRAKEHMILPTLEQGQKVKSFQKALVNMREEGVVARKIALGSGCDVDGLEDVIGDLVQEREDDQESSEEDDE